MVIVKCPLLACDTCFAVLLKYKSLIFICYFPNYYVSLEKCHKTKCHGCLSVFFVGSLGVCREFRVSCKSPA